MKHKFGDTRADGYRYWGVQKKKMKTGLKTYAVWLSPATYETQVERNRAYSRERSRKVHSYYMKRKKPFLARVAKAWKTLVG
jgi:hypothetical protein